VLSVCSAREKNASAHVKVQIEAFRFPGNAFFYPEIDRAPMSGIDWGVLLVFPE